MSEFKDAWLAHQRQRWMRPDAHRFIRPDAYRFMPPGAPRLYGKDAVRYFWPEFETDQRAHTSERKGTLDMAAERAALLRRKSEFAAIKAELKFRQFLRKAGFNPNQPRVPAGNPDGGQWTSDGGGTRVGLAAGDKPRLGPAAVAAIAVELARRAIEAYRSENSLWDLFRGRIGTVSYTTINGENVFGSNSTSPTYMNTDHVAAERMRHILIERYPDLMDTVDIGRRPNDALFHAETTVLLRAARANGGTLAGRTLEVFTDRPMCPSCDVVLPYVGRELGNPTVTFVGPRGSRRTLRNGSWVE